MLLTQSTAEGPVIYLVIVFDESAVDTAMPAYMVTIPEQMPNIESSAVPDISKQHVDIRCYGGALRENHQEATTQQHENHRCQPPPPILQKKSEKLVGNGKLVNLLVHKGYLLTRVYV